MKSGCAAVPRTSGAMLASALSSVLMFFLAHRALAYLLFARRQLSERHDSNIPRTESMRKLFCL